MRVTVVVPTYVRVSVGDGGSKPRERACWAGRTPGCEPAVVGAPSSGATLRINSEISEDSGCLFINDELAV